MYAIGTSTIGIFFLPTFAVTSGQNTNPVQVRPRSRNSWVRNSLKQVASSVIARPYSKFAVTVSMRFAT